MGRGRAKAKQTKVARELKYNTAGMTDLERLAAELAAGGVAPRAVEQDDEDDDDPYAKYVVDEDEDEDDVPAPADRAG